MLAYQVNIGFHQRQGFFFTLWISTYDLIYERNDLLAVARGAQQLLSYCVTNCVTKLSYCVTT